MQVGRDTVPLQETFDTTAKGGYNVINESSRKLMDARESTYGLLMQQDAAAWHYMKLADNTPLYTHNGVEFGIDATNRADFEKLAAHFESKYGADDVAIVHGEGKARVVLLDDDVSKYRDFLEEARNFAKENNVSIRSGHTDTGYINGKWENGVPKSYLEAIDSVPGAAEALDKVLPGMAKDILSTIERHGGDIPEISRKVYQALAEGGLEGLRNLSVSAGVVGVIALEILSQIESGAGNGAYTDV